MKKRNIHEVELIVNICCKIYHREYMLKISVGSQTKCDIHMWNQLKSKFKEMLDSREDYVWYFSFRNFMVWWNKTASSKLDVHNYLWYIGGHGHLVGETRNKHRVITFSLKLVFVKYPTIPKSGRSFFNVGAWRRATAQTHPAAPKIPWIPSGLLTKVRCYRIVSYFLYHKSLLQISSSSSSTCLVTNTNFHDSFSRHSSLLSLASSRSSRLHPMSLLSSCR